MKPTKPCPSCGSYEIGIEYIFGDRTEAVTVGCFDCGFQGDKVAIWDSRSPENTAVILWDLDP